MDAFNPITTALILGATAALQKTAGQVVEDAYHGLKTVIINRFQSTKAAVTALEADPADHDTRHFVETKVNSTQAASDQEVLHQAKALLQLIKAQAPQLERIVGLKLDQVEFDDDLTVGTVKSAGHGMSMTRSKVKGKTTIENVEAGLVSDAPNA